MAGGLGPGWSLARWGGRVGEGHAMWRTGSTPAALMHLCALCLDCWGTCGLTTLLSLSSHSSLIKPQIRKAWMKANLLVHPDKVRQRNGTPEQVAIADMIFDVLKDAWNTFQTTGR